MRGFLTIIIFIIFTIISFGLCFTHNSRDLEVYLSAPTFYQIPPSSDIKYYAVNFEDSVRIFSWSLFQGSKLVNSTANLILSPILVQYLLGILEYGAEGETKNQIRDVIGYSTGVSQIKNIIALSSSSSSSSSSLSLSRRSVEITSATGIFLDSSNHLNRTFANIVRNIGSDIISLNFENSNETKNIINQWVSKKTEGYIKELISSTYHIENSEIILTSAIYFHSTWKYKFNTVGPMPFYVQPEKIIYADFMEIKNKFLFTKIDLGNNYMGSAVEIPYQGDEYSMVIILPDSNVPLDAFIRRLNVSNFNKTLNILSNRYKKLMKLRMPKFHISSYFSVVNSLLKMGLVNLFTINSRLPYIGLNGEQKISDIVQQAILNVDEFGTDASAATAVVLIPLIAINDEFNFIVNRPFLSIILDKKNQIPLFISKIFTPKL